MPLRSQHGQAPFGHTGPQISSTERRGLKLDDLETIDRGDIATCTKMALTINTWIKAQVGERVMGKLTSEFAVSDTIMDFIYTTAPEDAREEFIFTVTYFVKLQISMGDMGLHTHADNNASSSEHPPNAEASPSAESSTSPAQDTPNFNYQKPSMSPDDEDELPQ